MKIIGTIFISLLTRGALGRKKAKKVRAIYLIMRHFKRFKLRRYLLLCIERFGNARRMQDYGKSIQWPKPPQSLRQTADLLKRAHAR